MPQERKAAAESVLIVEDDPTMLRALDDNFKYDGYSVTTASDGEKGLELALDSKPDLIVLDIMLPKINGYEICRILREEGLEVPVVMLTAKGQESDIVLGLNLGADDYVTKPFSIRELLARARALLRRERRGESRVHRFGAFTLDADSRRLLRDGREVALTPKEFGLLEILIRKAPRALTRDEILKLVWGYNTFVTRRSIDRCVTTLRKKIEPDPGIPTFIITVREVGYRFHAPPE